MLYEHRFHYTFRCHLTVPQWLTQKQGVNDGQNLYIEEPPQDIYATCSRFPNITDS